MGKTVVVYNSKAGYTKKYAHWIGEELGADVLIGKQTDLESLQKYDTIIYGGGLYAGGINGVKIIMQNLEKLKNKKLILFAVGLTSIRDEIFNEVKNRNLTKEQQQMIRFFMFRGGFDYKNLNLKDKFLMNILKMIIKSKKEISKDNQGMLDSFKKPVDFTNKDSITPLLEYLKVQS